MFWHITKLILRTWGHRWQRLTDLYPLLWVGVVLFPLLYMGGAALLHGGVYEMLAPMTTASAPNLALALRFTLFSSFGFTVSLLTAFAYMLTPDESLIERVMTPLPISPWQRQLGAFLPGLLLLAVAQLLLWAPMLSVFPRLQISSLAPLIITSVLGLFCYMLMIVGLYQLGAYVMRRTFGVQSAALRGPVLAVMIALNMLAQTGMTIAGGSALTTNKPLGWLWTFPAYWMAVALGPNSLEGWAALGLLVVATLIGCVCYGVGLQGNAKLADGTRGLWLPLRGMPLSRPVLLSVMVYEWKATARDYALVTGMVLWATLEVGAGSAVLWYRSHTDPSTAYTITQAMLALSAMALATIAQTSWGRDQTSRRLLASLPITPQTWLHGKLLANGMVIGGLWLLGAVGRSALVGEPLPLFDVCLILVPLVLFAFLVGIMVPYSNQDPLATMMALGLILIIGVPALLLSSQGVDLLLAMLPTDYVAPSLVTGYILLLAMIYLGIVQFDRMKQEQRYA